MCYDEMSIKLSITHCAKKKKSEPTFQLKSKHLVFSIKLLDFARAFFTPKVSAPAVVCIACKYMVLVYTLYSV